MSTSVSRFRNFNFKEGLQLIDVRAIIDIRLCATQEPRVLA
jgi:hypothetical protein